MNTTINLPAPSLDLKDIATFLTENGLLREIIQNDLWTLDNNQIQNQQFDAITYDTRQITPSSLLFCKGNFKKEYIEQANTLGLTCYVSETPYEKETHATGVIVNDIRKAMALLSARFYKNPEKHLFMIGITGTKGKTTTTYYTHAILNHWTNKHTAILSSEADCLDGVNWIPADLTTPESLDLFRLLRTAVDNGMTHAVMEISSQAYKINRVYGLHYNLGAFLNISPDHISPIEHPTFEDYFYSKRRIVQNADKVVINNTLGWKTDLIKQAAQISHCAYTTYSLDPSIPADINGTIGISGTAHFYNKTTDFGNYKLAMEGDFNYENALAAVTIARTVGVDNLESFHALEQIIIPGRMQRFTIDDGVIGYVDYAHNYISLKVLLNYVRSNNPNSRITVVTGTAGNKAIDRREGLAKAASENADCLILTQEDSDREDVRDINNEVESFVTNPQLDVRQIYGNGRENAINTAFEDGKKDYQQTGRTNIILVIGKGDEAWVKINGQHVVVRSDLDIVSSLAAEYKNNH